MGERSKDALRVNFDQKVKLEFMEYLRPEEKYDSVGALLEQIQKDIEKTRAILD